MASKTESADTLSKGADLPPLAKERLDVHLAEYNALREEIKWLNHEAAQYQNFAIALLPFFAAAIGLTDKSIRTLLLMLLIAPAPFCILGLLYLRQRVEVQVVADYIEKVLCKRIREILHDDTSLWTWEEYKRRRNSSSPGRGGRPRKWLMARENGILLQRALLFLLPALFALLFACYLAATRSSPSFRAAFGFPVELFGAFWAVNLIVILVLGTSIVRSRLSDGGGS